MEKKKFALIGCGHIAKRHALHIENNAHAELVGVFDIDTSTATLFGKAHGVEVFKSLNELITHSGADVFNICTPNGTHAEIAKILIAQNKSVVVEKPMATNASDAQEMHHMAMNAANAKMFVVKQNRYNPPVMAVKKLIETQKLGKVYMVAVNCYWNRNKAYYAQSPWRGSKKLDGGVLYTQFSHFVDIMYYLFGGIENVQGSMANLAHEGQTEIEDSGTFSFNFTSGGLGSFAFTTAAYQKNMEGSITIFAENATIKIGGKYLNTIDYQETNGFDITHVPQSSPANDYGFYEGSMSNHHLVISNVVNTLNGQETEMTNSFEGFQVVKMIDQFYEAAKK